jgi:hypothetical protein
LNHLPEASKQQASKQIHFKNVLGVGFLLAIGPLFHWGSLMSSLSRTAPAAFSSIDDHAEDRLAIGKSGGEGGRVAFGKRVPTLLKTPEDSTTTAVLALADAPTQSPKGSRALVAGDGVFSSKHLILPALSSEYLLANQKDNPLDIHFNSEYERDVCFDPNEPHHRPTTLCIAGERDKAPPIGPIDAENGWVVDEEWPLSWSSGAGWKGGNGHVALPYMMFDKQPKSCWDPNGTAAHLEHWTVLDLRSLHHVLGVRLESSIDYKHTVRFFRLEAADSKNGPWIRVGHFEYTNPTLPGFRTFTGFRKKTRFLRLVVESTWGKKQPHVIQCALLFKGGFIENGGDNGGGA